MHHAAAIRHRWAPVVLAALALLAWAAWGTERSQASTAARVSVCPTAGLSVVLRFGPGSGSAGHFTGALLFRNRSSTSCSLRGYPGVSFVDSRGRQIGIPADRATGRVRSVTLAPGQTAGAQLTLVDVGVFDAATCRPTRASGLRVFPPNHRQALITRHAVMVCRRAVRDASVGPVIPRSQVIPGSV